LRGAVMRTISGQRALAASMTAEVPSLEPSSTAISSQVMPRSRR
jgi:hypothetical protein